VKGLWANSNHIIIAVIHQVHLALEIIDIKFEALSKLHLDHKEVIAILLKLLSGSVLIDDGKPASALWNSGASASGENKTSHRQRL